ncbi:hypothetical protein N7528_010371 [Penicillium herquei]|nr:hypothetical protein N7528_010371 [Penicillium herquei]
MRTIEETRKRWEILFLGNDTSSDLEKALRAEQGGKLCNEGLRSICWKVFLLFEGLDREQWAQKLAESRDAYSALRDHFMKYIEHPDDLESTADPLADDEESPWQTLRDDENLRAEILQDVDRCLQENVFFQEPTTKAKLTDVLFVYSKLNPDVGYRQGMHELLAPILWVVDRDSVDQNSIGLENSTSSKDDARMLDLLDPEFVEHDSFTLFLSVMQTARIFYEHGETKTANGQVDVIPIVSRCQYLHTEALMIIDQELAEHLQAVDVLPQIFLTRWMRLLFGREFPFDEVLLMWDTLFAHGLRSDLIDFTCIAMLLRIRWDLLKADYSGALSMLLRYPSPEPHAPHEFVQDALYLEQNPTAERGSSLIAKYSGKFPESPKRHSQSGVRPTRRAFLWEDFKSRSDSSSPASSPARNSPKSLEALFQDVSQGIQRRTESWGVAKAVRGAVTEARKNMQTMHYEPGRLPPVKAKPGRLPSVPSPLPKPSPVELGLEKRINHLEERNKELSTALAEALAELRTHFSQSDSSANDAVKEALTRAKSVQRCLEDPLLPVVSAPAPVPCSTKVDNTTPEPLPDFKADEHVDVAQEDQQGTALNADAGPSTESGTCRPVSVATTGKTNAGQADGEGAGKSIVRPSLTDSGFSWMLEGSRNVSSFVSSASVPPEQTRRQQDHHGRNKGNPLFGNGDEKAQSNAEHELALHSLRGTGPL